MAKKSAKKPVTASKSKKPSITGKRVGLGYDAAHPVGRSRRIRVVSTLSEDKELKPLDRQMVISEAREVLRNFSLAGFIVRKHNQFVTDFSFESVCKPEEGASEERKREIDAFNVVFEEKIKWWQKRKNCDIAQRHNFGELLELIETHRVFDGDVGILKVSGGRIQIIEGDRIRNPTDPAWSGNALPNADYEWVHGIKVGRTGRAFRYAISRRLPNGGFEFEREVSADSLFLAGYFARIDQMRGIGKFVPIIDFINYLYEGIGAAAAKAKLGQLLGVFSTHAEEAFDVNPETGQTSVERIAEQLLTKLGPEIGHITGNLGETVQMIRSESPTSDFQNFCVMVIRLVFAALDIPYSFFDGSAANFYGQKGELENYIGSVNKKQADLIELLEDLTDWLLAEWVASGELVLPTGYGIEDVKYEWTGAGLPAWRLLENIKDAQVAILSGLLNPVDYCKSHKTSIWKNLDGLSDVITEAKRLGLKLAIDAPELSVNVGN